MNYREQYQNRGYLSPIEILDPPEAEDHRRQLELVDAQIGNMHYLPSRLIYVSKPNKCIAA